LSTRKLDHPRLPNTPLAPSLALRSEFTLPSATSIGDLLGVTIDDRYRIQRRLGQGGMGAVYVATHAKLGTEVAVKVLHASLASDPEQRRRFYREARAANALSHPNVVKVLDFGETDALTYLVMELLVGVSLGDFLEDLDELPTLEHVRLVSEGLLDGLAAAHEAEIVHRDLKPDNVFLARGGPGESFTVKLVDFGLAHVDVVTDPDTLTLTTHVAGTPAYMSPEQCRSLVVGPSTDLYAFGCILTEMLQGAPPFASSAQVDLMAKQLFAPPPPLHRPVDREPVPPLLEALRRSLLAKDPSLRPPSALETKERLLEALDPDRARQRLPDRTRAMHQSRTDRVPRWTDPAPPPAHPSQDLRDVLVVGEPLSDGQELALASLGLRLVGGPEARDVVVLLRTPSVAAVRDAARLGRVLCVADPSAAELRDLVAAGACDVVSAGAPFDAVSDKLLRLARKKRR
jgi:eukaryotic-like serine/threonine-protein kinase